MCLRDLAELQRIVRLALHANQVADLGNIRRLLRVGTHAVGVQERPRPFHAVPANMLVAGTGHHLQAGLVDLSDDGGFKAADRALLGQFGGPGFTRLARQA
ncbi:hypothetical protein FQZ97_967900 [compost metagenome]